MIKYRHHDMMNVTNKEIRRQVKYQVLFTILGVFLFFLFKINRFLIMEIQVVFYIIFFLSITDIIINLLELLKRIKNEI